MGIRKKGILLHKIQYIKGKVKEVSGRGSQEISPVNGVEQISTNEFYGTEYSWLKPCNGRNILTTRVAHPDPNPFFFFK